MSTELTLTLSSAPVPMSEYRSGTQSVLSEAKSLTKKGKVKKIQGRSWQLIIPSEWESLEAIKEVGKRVARNYYYIEHSHDVNELNEPVKSHWHILLTMSSSRDLGTVQNYFKDFPELLENSFEKIGSIHWAKRYLVHADDPNKFQYNYKDVETNDILFKDLFIPLPSKVDETNYTIEVFEQMGDMKTFRQFLSYFENQLATMSNYQRINLIITLRRYYNEYNNEYRINKDGFTPIDPPYNYAKDEKYKEEVLPF